MRRCCHVLGSSRFFGSLLVALAAFLGHHAFAQTTYSKIVVFGDSLSDTGNIAHLTQSATGGKVRYPSDIPPLFDYTDGRFTDGKDTQPAAESYFGVWIEQLAASIRGKPTVTDSLDGGTNFAYGDATTANGITTLSEGPLSIGIHNMGQQVADYLGNSPAPSPNAQTLYVLWGGANDLLGAARNNQDPVPVAAAAVNNELALLQQLMAAGATQFMLPNLPPLGGLPSSASSPSATALNNASLAFAQGLAQGLAALKTSAAAQGVTLTIYQPDILSLFTTIASNPMSFALGTVATSAQNVSGNPDTYLIWDGLHPTTTGHHFAAAAAANLLTAQMASTIVLAAPAPVLSSQAVSLTAKVSGSASGAIPTGLVSFFSGTTLVGSAALDATGTGAVSVASTTISGAPGTVTAVYAGDTTYKVSASAAEPVTVLSTAVGTTTTLTASAATTGSGSQVTLTATVSPAVSTYGTPTGTVTFYDGQSSLGTGSLSAGTATLNVSTLGNGTHALTASYAASGVFAASVSSAYTETIVAPSFTPAASPASVTVTAGNAATTTLTAQSMYGYSGTLTLSCGSLPAHLACSFSSPTLTVSGTNTPVPSSTLTIATNASAALNLPTRPGAWSAPAVFSATLLCPLCAGLGLFGLRRRRLAAHRSGRGSLWLMSALFLFVTSAALGLSGCGSNNNAGPGTYTVPVLFTPNATSSGAAQTLNVTVTVQ